MEPLGGLVLTAGKTGEHQPRGRTFCGLPRPRPLGGRKEEEEGIQGFCFLVPGVGGEDVVGRGSLQGTTLLLSRRKCHLQ